MRAFLVSLCGRHFWIPGYLALALGLVLPGDDWSWLTPGVPLLLGGILFFACLRLPWHAVVEAVGDGARWRRVGWLTILKMLILPLAAWALVQLLAPAWSAGILLVALMPAGLSSVAMAGLMGGNALTALLLVVATSLLCLITVPGLLALLAGSAPSASAMAGRAAYILILLVVPFVAAQVVRRIRPATIDRHAESWGMASIACALLLILVSVLTARASWRGYGWIDLLAPVALGSIAIAINATASLFLARVLAHGEAAAFACGALWLNNGLAVAFATRFFPGEGRMLLPAVAIQVPIIAALAGLGALHRRRLRTEQAPAVIADA